MIGTFLYLTACSVKNRTRRRLRRLREPRYLIGAIVGAMYFYFVVFRRGGSARAARHGLPPSMFTAFVEPMVLVGGLALLVTALVAWVWPRLGKSLTFTRAEVQHLFTAPVTRRDLVHYKLLRSQIGMLFSSLLAAALLRPATLTQAWTLLVGLWLLLTVLRLHLMAVALSRASLAHHGSSGVARQWIPVSIAVGVVGVLAATLVSDWPTLGALSGADAVFAELRRLSTTGAAGIVLWPFQALVRLPLAVTAAEFWSRLPPVLILAVLNYAWVLRADASFEEASADHAERKARERLAPGPVSRGPVTAPFALAADGPPETAILWKNLIFVGRYVSVRTFLRVLPLVAVLALVARNASAAGGVSSFLAALCLPLAAMTVLLGPQMLRNDLRQDLGQLALLKTWPIHGARIVRGEVLAPTLVLSAIVWLLILAGAVLAKDLTAGVRAGLDIAANRLSYALAAALVGPALILSQTVVQNGLAVLFPAWVTIGANRARGLDAMGQRLLMLAGVMLALALSVLPGALVAIAVVVMGQWLLGITLVIVPAAMVALAVLVECWVATELLGRVLDRTDPASLDVEE